MSNIVKKLLLRKTAVLKTSVFWTQKIVTRSVFGKKNLRRFLQLTQISLNFKTSCCKLKITDLGAKLCVAFLLF